MEQAHAPGYLDETEALLGVPYFYDDVRNDALRNDYESLDEDDLAMRDIVYTGALRVLAAARSDERMMSGVVGSDIRDFNEGWELTSSRIRSVTMQYGEQVGRLP